MPFGVRSLRSGNALPRAATSAVLTILLAFSLGLFRLAVHAQSSAPGPKFDPTYQALRNLTLGGEAVAVSNFALQRDAGTFHLHTGTVCFVAPVKGDWRGVFR
jgi:hypothetical protein